MWRDLANSVRGEVRFSPLDRLLYATDASIYQQEPRAVVIPADEDDAASTLEWCHRHAVPALPRGGGTSLAGQCVADAVVIDTSAMCNAVRSIDTRARRCRVGPGITVDRLNRMLQNAGLLFAPDPSTVRQATIGGCIGNNAAGARSIRYGRTSENVLGVDLALADGRVLRFDEGAAARDPAVREITERVVNIIHEHAQSIRERFPRTKRRSAGYQLDVILEQLERSSWDVDKLNLAPLICGSEGTLGMVLSAELQLVRAPESESLVVIPFKTLDAAIAAVPALLAMKPSAVELLDDLIIRLAKTNPEQRRHVEILPTPHGAPPAAYLFVEFQGGSEDVLQRAHDCADSAEAGSAAVYTTPEAIRSAWALRRAGEPLLHAIPGRRKPVGFVEDNAVPVGQLAEFVRRSREIFSNEGTYASFYAHASVGVLHIRPLLDLKDDADEKRMHRIALSIADLARELGGVMSGEHGDGRARGPLLESFFGPQLMGAFRDVKRTFDPKGILNPGNITDPGQIESISGPTRTRAAHVTEGVIGRTFFDHTANGGLVHASEMCNGAGVCRSTTSGAMCPVFRATRDESRSTRGWGNTLRLAITGQLTDSPGPDWDHPQALASLGLCLSCKACKSECPTSVDIATLKAEYAAQSARARGSATRQARFFGTFDDALRRAVPFRYVANKIASRRWARRVLANRYGIDERRSLPKIVKPLQRRWPKQARLPLDAPVVVLVGDAFTNAFEPEIGLATCRVLNALGYRVELVLCGDLARARISVGLLEDAATEIDGWMQRLRPFIVHRPDVAGFVVCEPSCLSAIKDEWVSLHARSSVDLRRELARRSFLPEQFLESRWDEHPRQPSFRAFEGRAVLHAHCHQRALWGAGSSAKALSRIVGPERVVAPDAGCCGMAGSYGFTRDRYELSMRIAEQSVVPTVAEANPGDALLATGTSCRHQILDATGEQARHPIELIASLLK